MNALTSSPDGLALSARNGQRGRMPASPPAPPAIGLIGLGLMGAAFSERLLAAGTAARLTENTDEVFACHDRIVLSFPDHHIVAAVLGTAPLRAGQIVIDMTTGAPEAAEATAAALAQRGVAYLDATVSGNSDQTRSGEAVYFVGGERTAFLRCADVFTALGGTVQYAGESGSGARMKLITNLVMGLNRVALAEGLAFARALGVEPEAALAALRTSQAWSRIMDTKGEKMISGDFTPQARLSQHLKDVRLMLAAAAARGLALPLSEAHRAVLEAAEALGLGGLDNTAIVRTYQPRDGE